MVTLLNQRPIAESYLAKVVVKNGHQKDMVAMRLNNGHNWKGLSYVKGTHFGLF